MSNHASDSPLTRPPSPARGLFTQTILPSPVIQWILPARLRSNRHNDVVFIGQKRVQIKEAIAGGYLENVNEKVDFPGSILAAKVLSVSTELPWETQLRSEDVYDGPSQILILSVDMRELLFLYCSPTAENEFVTFARPMPHDVSLQERFGKNIAVDPKSRAVAEKFYAFEGHILFMEFLYPKTADDKSIILLLLVHKFEATHAVMYTWGENDNLNLTHPHKFEYLVRSRDAMPTMIIPLTKESAFLMITTTSMSIYPSSEDDDYRHPKNTAFWPPTKRSVTLHYGPDGLGPHATGYGWIYFLEFGSMGQLENQTYLGQLHCDVDTAFDVLNMGREGGDFILAAGSMGDGGLFVQEARDQPRCVQRFLNWAPITDSSIVCEDSDRTSYGAKARNRLFASSVSSSGSGAIHEFRYGVEAQLGITVALDDFQTIQDMWTMSDDTTGGIYILLSDPFATLLLYMNSDLEDGISELDEEQTGLDSAQTIAAGCTSDGAFIQVTERATHIFVPMDLSSNSRVPHEPQTYILTAAVDGESSTLAIAARRENVTCLYLASVIKDTGNFQLDIGPPIAIERDPVCLCLQKLGDVTFIFMSTVDSKVAVFHVENQSIKYIFDTDILVETDMDISKVVESFATLRYTSNGSLRAFVLCGLRSGYLVPFEIDFNASQLIGLKRQAAKRVGTTSIRLQSKGSFALFTCGTELWHPAYFPLDLHGFGLISPQNPDPKSPLGPLFCFADQQLLICSLSQQFKMVPRRIGLPGTPGKITYSPHLQCLIASYSITEVEDPESSPFASTTRSYLEFVDPNSQQPVLHRNRADMKHGTEVWRPSADCGETITCIVDWVFQKNSHLYHMIAIGTSLPAMSDDSPNRGRFILLAVEPNQSRGAPIECFTKHVQTVDGPVRAIAPCHDSLIVAAGKKLVPFSSRNAEMRWSRGAPFDLPSAAVAISVIHDRFVFVTTARHSWMCLEILRGTGSSNAETDGAYLAARSSDFTQRDGLHHLVCAGPDPFVFTSSRGGSIGAFRIGEDQGTVSPFHMSPFRPEGQLSDSVLRLVSEGTGEGMTYGFALNGTVYRLCLVQNTELLLLRVLQNLCYKDVAICPSLPKRLRRQDPLSVDNRHIDGDILSRLARLGPEKLGQMVMDLDSAHGSDSIERSIREYADNAIGASSADAIVGWLRSRLHVEL
ncbi:hypothetical protein N7512_002798 [Penicillium capsulatum]|nr:hypothetical protein N7512_002798 [Penicillium capsulatum]